MDVDTTNPGATVARARFITPPLSVGAKMLDYCARLHQRTAYRADGGVTGTGVSRRPLPDGTAVREIV